MKMHFSINKNVIHVLSIISFLTRVSDCSIKVSCILFLISVNNHSKNDNITAVYIGNTSRSGTAKF